MLQANSSLILQRLRPPDLVLDIGGWAHPFNRANYIMDAQPFATRGAYNRTFARTRPILPIGGSTEFFNAESWIQRDICDRQPYPFADKSIDFVICSHTLEDVRDPLWVCSEMVRIGRAGYIEVPSRVWETCRGLEPGIAGLAHHRWLIEIEGQKIRFILKYHLVHNWRYSFSPRVLRALSEEQSVQWLFWNDGFQYEETTFYGDDLPRELERFVDSVHPHPAWRLRLHSGWQGAAGVLRRANAKLARLTHRRPVASQAAAGSGKK